MSGPWVAAFVVLAAVVLLTVVLVLGLLRRVAVVLERAEAALGVGDAEPDALGAPPGTAVPPFSLADERGDRVSFADAIAEPTIVLFLEPGCGPCGVLAEELAGHERIGGLPLLVVLDEAARDAPDAPRPPGVRIAYQAGGAASRAFASDGTPHAFVVDAGGRVVARGVPNALEDLTRLAAATDA